MNKTPKMNFLYKIAFILLMLCIPLFVAAIAVAYLFEEIYFSAVFSAGGALLAFVGIILVMFSKPKKIKEKTSVQDDEFSKPDENLVDKT